MNIFLENIYNLSFFFNTGIGIFSFVCIYILVVLLILPALGYLYYQVFYMAHIMDQLSFLFLLP